MEKWVDNNWIKVKVYRKLCLVIDNNWIKVKVYEKLCLVINEARMPYIRDQFYFSSKCLI